jgi:hypothetical protein
MRSPRAVIAGRATTRSVCSHWFSVDSRADDAVSTQAGDVSADTLGRSWTQQGTRAAIALPLRAAKRCPISRAASADWDDRMCVSCCSSRATSHAGRECRPSLWSYRSRTSCNCRNQPLSFRAFSPIRANPMMAPTYMQMCPIKAYACAKPPSTERVSDSRRGSTRQGSIAQATQGTRSVRGSRLPPKIDA